MVIGLASAGQTNSFIRLFFKNVERRLTVFRVMNFISLLLALDLASGVVRNAV